MDGLSALFKSKPNSPQLKDATDSNLSEMLAKLIREQENPHEKDIIEEGDETSPLPPEASAIEGEEEDKDQPEGRETPREEEQKALFSEEFYKDFEEVQLLEAGLKKKGDHSPKEVNLTRSFISESFGAEGRVNSESNESISQESLVQVRKKTDRENSRSGQRSEARS